MKKKSPFVREYLERVSWRVLEKRRPEIRRMIRGHAGIYALYRGDQLYYVGLANNLMARVNQHLKDRHRKKWDRFSVYLTANDAHIRPLESLLLRVIDPSGNRVKGRLAGARDLAKQLKRDIEERAKDEVASLLGGKFAARRRRAKTRAKKGSLVLAGLVDKRLQLQANYKGKLYKAALRRDGQISYKGKLYSSPSAVAIHILKRSANGWSFWHFRKARGLWVPLAELR